MLHVRYLNFFLILMCILFLPACVSAPPMVQPQINSLVIAHQYDNALSILQNNRQSYGEKNYLLYLLDYGLIQHLAGHYEDSIKFFEEAKKLYDQMYTTSISKEAMTWLVNDYAAPYRGEDFERVIVNIFQALNFVALGQVEEALVEARDVDSKLSLINRQYKPDRRNVYKEDAFARLLMGILYETSGSEEDLNNAFISYIKALEVYEKDYASNYQVPVPEVLKENLLAVAERFDEAQYRDLQAKFADTSFLPLDQKKKKAQVYVFEYQGLSPIKHQIDIPIPLPNGYITKLAFPTYDKRYFETKAEVIKAVDLQGREVSAPLEVGEDIGAIAMTDLNNRKARVIGKAVARAGGKYILESSFGNALEDRHGRNTARYFKFLSSLYNISSEQADLRSWQTLPDTINIGRLIVDAGEYDFFLGENKLGHSKLKVGEQKFIIYRSQAY